MITSVPGRAISVKATQLRNALDPMWASDGGSVTLHSKVQKAKALSSIRPMLAGRTISFSTEFLQENFFASGKKKIKKNTEYIFNDTAMI